MTSNRPYLLRAVHEWICDNGLTPYVVADATQPDLRVPPQAISEGRVVLNLAPRAVTHLEIGNDAITFMARFGGVSHAVTLPIAAVQAIYARENGQGMLLAEGAAGTVAEESPESSPAPPSKAPLQSVPTLAQDASGSGDSGDAAPTDGGDPDKARPKGKPSLHVVK
ncbi:MAG TPA: ClpXP protease specificity-enhancing factor [Rhodanobacteraceae bacterium]|nr:ClpXP protease specificity-enhancing factor [Rhodanobacteraceae bacterium]